jgi:hypothetical protein
MPGMQLKIYTEKSRFSLRSNFPVNKVLHWMYSFAFYTCSRSLGMADPDVRAEGCEPGMMAQNGSKEAHHIRTVSNEQGDFVIRKKRVGWSWRAAGRLAYREIIRTRGSV